MEGRRNGSAAFRVAHSTLPLILPPLLLPCSLPLPPLLQTSHGFVFLSETDTEVIPMLCQYLYANCTAKVSLAEVGGGGWAGGGGAHSCLE